MSIKITRINRNELIFICFFRNILVDKPSDQTSRWSSDIDNPRQVNIRIFYSENLSTF